MPLSSMELITGTMILLKWEKTLGGKKEKEIQKKKESVIRESHAIISERDCKLGNIFSFQGSLELIILNVLLIPESSWSSSKYLAKALWCEAKLECILRTNNNNNSTSHFWPGHVFRLDTAIRAFVHTGWTAALFQHKASALSEDDLYRPAFVLIKQMKHLRILNACPDKVSLLIYIFVNIAQIWESSKGECTLWEYTRHFVFTSTQPRSVLQQAYFRQKGGVLFVCFLCWFFFQFRKLALGFMANTPAFGLLGCLSSNCMYSFHSRCWLTWYSQQCDPKRWWCSHLCSRMALCSVKILSPGCLGRKRQVPAEPGRPGPCPAWQGWRLR